MLQIVTVVDNATVAGVYATEFTDRNSKQSKAKQKQRCVMGVGMCLYAQLVQTKNK